MWSPIPFTELYDEIIATENRLIGDAEGLWKLIRIIPEKWHGKKYGEEGGGFWVVAIYGRNVVWYNDIEEGFNISTYHKYGEIDEYWCNQSTLDEVIIALLSCIRFRDNYIIQAGPPKADD